MTLKTYSSVPSEATSSSVSLEQEFAAYKYALSQLAGVAIVNADGIVLETNDYLCQLLGCENSALVGSPCIPHKSYIQSASEAEQLWRAMSEGRPWQGEVRHYPKKGSCCWLEINLIPLPASTGEVDRSLFVAQDITYQCQIDEQRQLQQQALAEQRIQNQALRIRLDGNNQILNLIVNGTPLAQTLDAIARFSETLASNLHCAIMVVDPMSGLLVHQAAPSLPPLFVETMNGLPVTPQGGAFAAAAYRRQPVIVSDIAADISAHYVNDVAFQHNLRACSARPILVRDHVAAVLGVYYDKAQYPSKTDQVIMDRVVELTQVAMERHRSETDLRNKLEQTLLLGQITQEIRQSLDTQEVFQIAVTRVRKLLQADRVAIARFTPPTTSGQNEIADQISLDEVDDRVIAEDVASPFHSILGLWVNGPIRKLKPRQNQSDESTASQLAPHDCVPDQSAPSPLSLNKLDATAPNVVDDIYYAGLNAEQIALMESLDIKASIAVPIMADSHSATPSSSAWGMLYIQQCSASRRWQDSEISFIQALTLQLSVAIQQADLLGQAQEKSVRLEQLLQTVQRQKHQQAEAAKRERRVSCVIQQIHKTRDIAKILATATEEARSLLNCDRVLIYRFRSNWQREIAHESFGSNNIAWASENKPLNWVDQNLKLQEGGHYRNGESTTVRDIFKSDFCKAHVQCLAQRGIRAFMVVPIFVGEQLWGLMGAYQHHKPRDWKFQELNFLERISGQLGVAFQQAELLKQLKIAKEKADAANEAKGTFLANMSHELRTPLNAILGFSQLMHRDAATTAKQQKTLNIINRSGAHLLALINDILDMSKIEAGSMVLNESDFDLHTLCLSVYELFQLKAESKGLELKLEWDEAVPRYVHSDERKLRQVLMNLMSNSLKFTHQGHIQLKVWRGEPVPLDPMTSLSSAPIRLWFSVSDTGAGIAAEEMEQLFDAFTQTESGRQAQEGTGLGLPISREFVRMMKGDLTLNSNLGQGTTAQFSVVLPPVVGEIACSPENQRVSRVAPGQPDYRLLVVEDRLENRTLLTKLLECVGFSVRTAENGEDAIAQWQDWKPHLIWMDLQMPVMDGFAATRTIRLLEAEQRQVFQTGSQIASPQAAPSQIDGPTTARSPEAPPTFVAESSLGLDRETYILAITASAFEETRTLTLEAGFDDFIRKPFQENLIFEKLTQYLGVRYCYETIGVNPELSLPTAPPCEPELHELLHQCKAMGSEWCKVLHQAAITLDEETVQQQLETLGDDAESLKTTLQNWAATLRLDKIVELTELPFTDST